MRNKSQMMRIKEKLTGDRNRRKGGGTERFGKAKSDLSLIPEEGKEVLMT